MSDSRFTIEGLKSDFDSPEKNLWAAVLSQAITDFHKTGKNGDETPTAKSARLWIFSERQDYFGSFINLCHLFDIDPARVRKKLLSDDCNVRPYGSGRQRL